MKGVFCGPLSAHSAGGKASAKRLTPEERSAKARKAGQAQSHEKSSAAAKLRWARRRQLAAVKSQQSDLAAA
jgi:hypothetical protein